MGNCFSCHKKLGMMNYWRNAKTIREYGYQPPERMSKDDKLCESCLDVIVNTQVKKTTESKKQNFCSKCGNNLKSTDNFCVKCGNSVLGTEITNKVLESKNETKVSSTKNNILKDNMGSIVAIAVIMVIFIGGLLAINPLILNHASDIRADKENHERICGGLLERSGDAVLSIDDYRLYVQEGC